MKDFAKIKTLFSSREDRTIEKLSKIYSNTNVLTSAIHELIDDELLINNYLKDKKILLKPNWVRHSLQPQDEICLRTNNNFLLSLIHILLEQKPDSIIIGDAPLQGCDWDKMHDKEFIQSIQSLSQEFDISVKIADFRRVTLDLANNTLTTERRPLSDYLIFDLGTESLLEPISSKKKNFRVTCYNPDRLAESHTKGIHKYCITKELFNADVVISLPKLKTHQKTGITGALKNLVGINGDKDFLPHHRRGGVKNGGDCYPDKHPLRLLSEIFLDTANRHIGKKQYRFWQHFSDIFWQLSKPQAVHQLTAGWYGNDTSWRMVMDLNKIAVYGKSDGTISKDPQRILYSLCDGIIGGQGNGPLYPEPLELGVIIFSDNSALADIITGTLMDFDINKIALLKNAKQMLDRENTTITLNNGITTLSNLSDYSISTLPPPGWAEYLGEK